MMNDIKHLLDNITPDIYTNLKQAVELGKWPTGQALTVDQRELCMQAMIAYEKKHLPAEEHTGYIPPKPHQHCGDKTSAIADETQPLQFTDSQ